MIKTSLVFLFSSAMRSWKNVTTPHARAVYHFKNSLDNCILVSYSFERNIKFTLHCLHWVAFAQSFKNHKSHNLNPKLNGFIHNFNISKIRPKPKTDKFLRRIIRIKIVQRKHITAHINFAQFWNSCKIQNKKFRLHAETHKNSKRTWGSEGSGKSEGPEATELGCGINGMKGLKWENCPSCISLWDQAIRSHGRYAYRPHPLR